MSNGEYSCKNHGSARNLILGMVNTTMAAIRDDVVMVNTTMAAIRDDVVMVNTTMAAIRDGLVMVNWCCDGEYNNGGDTG